MCCMHPKCFLYIRFIFGCTCRAVIMMDTNWAMNDWKSQNREHFTRQATNIFGEKSKTARKHTNYLTIRVRARFYVTHAFSWISLCQSQSQVFSFQFGFCDKFYSWNGYVKAMWPYSTVVSPSPCTHTHTSGCRIKCAYLFYGHKCFCSSVIFRLSLSVYESIVNIMHFGESLWCQSPMNRVVSFLRFYFS